MVCEYQAKVSQVTCSLEPIVTPNKTPSLISIWRIKNRYDSNGSGSGYKEPSPPSFCSLKLHINLHVPAREDLSWNIFRHSNLHLSIIKLSALGTQGVGARDVPLLHLLKNTTICFTDQNSDSIGQFLVWDRRMVMCAEFCNLATDLKITQKFYSGLAKWGWLWRAQSGSWGRTAPKHSDTSCNGCNKTFFMISRARHDISQRTKEQTRIKEIFQNIFDLCEPYILVLVWYK